MNINTVFLNIKYNTYYTYSDGIIYDTNNKPVPKSNIIYKIIEKYKDMLHYLTNIKIIPHKSMIEADNSLVYKGIDSKGKEQYKYGDNYILRRKQDKIKTFLKIYKKMNIIQNIITEGLKEKDINKKFLFASILLVELTFYIRLGKEIYYKTNNTIGLLTLQKHHLLVDNNKIIIKFIGKTNKEQIFYCYKNEQPILYEVLLKLYNASKDYIFITHDGLKFTERILNLKLKKLNLSFKNFRTYGVNILIIKKIYENIKNKNNINIIKDSIKETAEYIGHTQNISKKSYLAEELQNILEDIIKENNNYNNFKNFLQYIVNKLESL